MSAQPPGTVGLHHSIRLSALVITMYLSAFRLFLPEMNASRSLLPARRSTRISLPSMSSAVAVADTRLSWQRCAGPRQGQRCIPARPARDACYNQGDGGAVHPEPAGQHIMRDRCRRRASVANSRSTNSSRCARPTARLRVRAASLAWCCAFHSRPISTTRSARWVCRQSLILR